MSDQPNKTLKVIILIFGGAAGLVGGLVLLALGIYILLVLTGVIK